MKVRSSSLTVTGAIVALSLALVIAGGGLAFAGVMSAEEAASPSLAREVDAAAVLDAKVDPVEAASASQATVLTAVALKTATPVVKPARRRPIRKAASPTPRSSAGGWRIARVSWYGPGFYGHTMAGGGKLTPTSMVVAHRTLPFGTKVEIEYKGRRVIAVVKDRGPYVRGRTFDLGPGTAKALGFSGVGTVRWRIVR